MSISKKTYDYLINKDNHFTEFLDVLYNEACELNKNGDLENKRKNLNKINNLAVTLFLSYFDIDGINFENVGGNYIEYEYLYGDPNDGKIKKFEMNIDGIKIIKFIDNFNEQISDEKFQTVLNKLSKILNINSVDNTMPDEDNVLRGYMFHLFEFIEENIHEDNNHRKSGISNEKKEEIDEEIRKSLKYKYENDLRFRLLISVFSKIKDKILTENIEDDHIKIEFAFKEKNGSGSYFYFPNTFTDFKDNEDMKKMKDIPEKLTLDKQQGLISILNEKNQFGSVWTIFNEDIPPTKFEYILKEKKIWDIEKYLFFPNINENNCNIIFIGAIPFIEFDNMYFSLFILGNFREGEIKEKLKEIRRKIGYISFYLYSISNEINNVINILKEESKKEILKKHFISESLQGKELLKGIDFSNKQDPYIIKINKVLDIFSNPSDKDKESKIFYTDGQGWYSQYFSYAFTEDIYEITLKAVKKLTKIIYYDKDDEYKILIRILDTFYSFQDRVKVSALDYRDHLVHQFQVFLIGLKIITSKWGYKNILKNKGEKEIKELCTSWLISSLFHDIGLPFEKIGSVEKDYIQALLSLDSNSIKFDKVSQDILFGKIKNENKELLELLYEILKISLTPLGIDPSEKEKFYWFFKKLFIEQRKHSITSSLFVKHNILKNLNLVDTSKSEIISSILIHDKSVWMEIAKRRLNYSDIKALTLKLKSIIDDCDLTKMEQYNTIEKYDVNNLIKDFNDDETKKSEASKNINKLPYWRFVFYQIFRFNSILKLSSEKEWNHKINPNRNPIQLLLLLSDALQESGRDLEKETINYENPIIKFEDKNDNLIIILEKNKKIEGKKTDLLFAKIYIDLYALQKLFDNCFNLDYIKADKKADKKADNKIDDKIDDKIIITLINLEDK